MREQRTLGISNLVSMKWQRHSKPVTIHSKRDLGRTALKVHHRHDDITLCEPPTKVTEFVVG